MLPTHTHTCFSLQSLAGSVEVTANAGAAAMAPAIGEAAEHSSAFAAIANKFGVLDCVRCATHVSNVVHVFFCAFVYRHRFLRAGCGGEAEPHGSLTVPCGSHHQGACSRESLVSFRVFCNISLAFLAFVFQH